jgi:hypothetical protein
MVGRLDAGDVGGVATGSATVWALDIRGGVVTLMERFTPRKHPEPEPRYTNPAYESRLAESLKLWDS